MGNVVRKCASTIFFSCILFHQSLVAQVDTSFWFAPPEISQDGFQDKPIILRVSTINQPAAVTVSIPANPAFTPITINIATGSTGSIDLTPWIDLIESKPPNTILNTGLRITSTGRINAYYEVVSGGYGQSCQCNPELFALKGKNALGKDFMIPSQNILQNWAYNPPSTHSFDIVATENNTNITIKPSKNIVGHVAGIPFVVSLNKGQVFSCTAANPFGADHLGGSVVTSDKNIAITLKDDGLFNTACWDLGGDQLVPVDNLSDEYIAIQGYLTSGITVDKVFVTAVSDNTSVNVGGTLFGVINAGQTLTIPFSSPALYITANNKIYALQISGSGCEVGLASLPSISCRGSSEVSVTRSSPAQLSLLVTTRTTNISSFLLNGTPVSSALFSVVPATANQWSYARISIPVAMVPALSSVRLTNTSGLFHLGVIHGDGPSGGARFGYFTDFASFALNALQDSLRVCGSSTTLDAGPGFVDYNWTTGAGTQTINVTQTGFYKVIVTNNEGCQLLDSSYVKLEPSSVDSNSNTFCAGLNYQLPWGAVVNTSGVYRDTLRYLSGCDSVHRIVNLQMQSPSSVSENIVICSGQTYTLPWGLVVNTSGIYRDTLRYSTGCDSIVSSVNLNVQSYSEVVTDVTICSGQPYTLPWGASVFTSGTYRDTLRYSTGCDSIRSIVNVEVKPIFNQSASGYKCSGQNYLLPWGQSVSSSGIYFDTLRYSGGCDSLITRFEVVDQVLARNNVIAAICEGQTYTLPWGNIVNTSGVYLDTLKYVSGCDSVIRSIDLTVQTPSINTIQGSVCPGQSFTLPSGTIVNIAGNYSDTVRSKLAGCDSLITLLTLEAGSGPVVMIAKSNDVNCFMSIAKLSVTGGYFYEWEPAESLDDPQSASPIASPSTTTLYRVRVTSDAGCTAADSIEVKVIAGPDNDGYLVPNAFTPNGDGKNDCFGVQTWGAVSDFEFSIYNRWGERIFYTKDPRQCWDGRYKGIEQGSGVFIYQLRAKGLCGNIYRKGTVTLIR